LGGQQTGQDTHYTEPYTQNTETRANAHRNVRMMSCCGAKRSPYQAPTRHSLDF
jgi:hypothetical protein